METLWRTRLFEVRSRHFDVIRVTRQCIIHIARDEGARYIVLTNINMRGSRCPYFQSKNIWCELSVVRARNYWGIDNRISMFSFCHEREEMINSTRWRFYLLIFRFVEEFIKVREKNLLNHNNFSKIIK